MLRNTAAGHLLVCAALIGSTCGSEAAGQEVVTRQAIIRQLTAPQEDHKGLVKIESDGAGEAGTDVADSSPFIAFPNIEFALGSSRLTPKAQAQLDELAAALVSDELRAFRFQIVGHTDASGGRDYNLALSERRAATVREYLVRTRGVESRNLEVLGRGMDAPSRKEDPYSAENRRVEIRNLGGK